MKKNSNNEIELAKLDLIRHLRKVVKNYNDNLSELKELEEKDHLRNWQPPVNGEVIMTTFGIGECRDVGKGRWRRSRRKDWIKFSPPRFWIMYN